MGQHAAANILRAIEHQPLRAVPLSRPRQHGDDRPRLGSRRLRLAAAEGLSRLAGWLFVHILNLIGFRNRLVVFVQWAWAYFSYQRSIRLITGVPETAPEAHAASRR